jgi:hypothetical protein
MLVHVFEPNLSRIGLSERVCAGLRQACAVIIEFVPRFGLVTAS